MTRQPRKNRMPVHNADITAIFEEIADLLEIEDANPFRIRAYRNAARSLGELPQDARQLVGRDCHLELNANPEPLDLLDVHCQIAREEGVLVSIDSDAHSACDLANLRYGVGQARRGWLEKRDVLNTRPLESLRKLLKRTM